LSSDDLAEEYQEEGMEYDGEMMGKTLWNDLTNLHKEIIKLINVK
jgi:hypothetical protein